MIFFKVVKIINGEKIVFLQTVLGKLDIQMQKKEIGILISCHVQKLMKRGLKT